MSQADALKVTCPNGHQLRVKAELAGERVRCPHKGCGAFVDVPEAEDPEPAPPSRPRKRRQRGPSAASGSQPFGSWAVFRLGLLAMLLATALFACAVLLSDVLAIGMLFGAADP